MDEHRPSRRKDAFFDQRVDLFAPGAFDAEQRAKIEWFRQRWGIREGMWIVEPGCGAGRLTCLLAEWVGPTGRVLAFDPSLAMVEAHRRIVAEPCVSCWRARAEEVELPARRAHRVICFSVFPHFDDKPAALRRLAGALRPDGLLFVAHLQTRDELNRMHQGFGDAVGGDRLPPESEMRRLFEQAGMRVTELADEAGRYHLCARLA